MVSRPLCLNQTSDRSTSSWVGDHQRILIAVYHLFFFAYVFFDSLGLFLKCTIYGTKWVLTVPPRPASVLRTSTSIRIYGIRNNAT